MESSGRQKVGESIPCIRGGRYPAKKMEKVFLEYFSLSTLRNQAKNMIGQLHVTYRLGWTGLGRTRICPCIRRCFGCLSSSPTLALSRATCLRGQSRGSKKQWVAFCPEMLPIRLARAQERRSVGCFSSMLLPTTYQKNLGPWKAWCWNYISTSHRSPSEIWNPSPYFALSTVASSTRWFLCHPPYIPCTRHELAQSVFAYFTVVSRRHKAQTHCQLSSLFLIL